jgi:hypothetical protein
VAKKYDREFLVAKVSMMRLRGKSTLSISEFLQEKVGMSRKIAYEILRDAQSLIIEQLNEDIKLAMAEAVGRLDVLYEEGDTKIKLEVQKELNKLRGLYSPSKLSVEGNLFDNITIEIVEPKIYNIDKEEEED